MSAEEKVLRLFPDVLKIIVQNDRNDNGCIRWWNLQEIMMACRLVCNSWKDTVDLVMQQDSSHMDLCPGGVYLFEYKREHTPCPLKLSYKKFDDNRWSDKLKALTRELRKNPAFIPIPTRHLMIEPSIDDQDSDKWNKYCGMVRRFLQVLGGHAWHLTVIVCGVYPDKSRDAGVVYKLISEWLRYVPNLKSVALYTWRSRSPLEDGDGRLFGKRSLPKFKDLITIQVSQYSPLTYQLLKSNRHIKKFRLATYFGTPLPSPSFLDLDFPNLSTFECYFYHLQDWEKFLKVLWRLSELSLGCYGKATELTAPAFFEGIQKFEKTLTSLTFNLSKEGWSNPENLEVKLNLPQLKHLHLVSHDLEPLSLENILAPLQCENLETFSLKLSQTYNSCQFSEITPFVNYVNNFPCRHSDWMNFPKLRNVKLTVNVNSFEMGDQRIHQVRRSSVNMPSVRFEVVEMDECHIWYWDQ